MQKNVVGDLENWYNAPMKKCSLLVVLLLAAGTIRPLLARDTVLRVDNAAAAVAAANKGTELANKGDLDGAIGYYSAAVKVDPQMYLAVYERGTIYMRQHKWDRAIADFNSALLVSPSFFLAAIKRAEVNGYLGRYDQALAELNHIIALRPMNHTNALAHSDRAWIFATSSNPAVRNGRQAVEDANLACRIDSWDTWDYIDTLAAAYAEAGDFENAIKFAEKAIKKARQADGVEDVHKRLALYQQHRPFRVAQH